MGKINTYKGIEVIPLDTNSNLSQLASRSKRGFLESLKMHRFPYLSDPTLVPRVQKVSFEMAIYNSRYYSNIVVSGRKC